MEHAEVLENEQNKNILYKILELDPNCTTSQIVPLTRRKTTEKWH
jgi:hypothetical protein